MNKKTLALTEEQYKAIITTIRKGFEYNKVEYKPNDRVAFALTLEANLGLRISDIVSLSTSSIIKDGDRYRLDIVEQKTNKTRTFTVPNEIYQYIVDYALDHGISKNARLVPISERAIQKHLKVVCEYLGLSGIGTHSFRKYFATSIYLNSNYNIEIVRELLQHSSAAITQRYIGIQQKEVEDALLRHIKLI